MFIVMDQSSSSQQVSRVLDTLRGNGRAGACDRRRAARPSSKCWRPGPGIDWAVVRALASGSERNRLSDRSL